MTKGELVRFRFFGSFLLQFRKALCGAFFGYGTCARLGLKSGDS